MSDVRCERPADRPLEAAEQGRDQSRPTGSLRPPAAILAPTRRPSAAQLTLSDQPYPVLNFAHSRPRTSLAKPLSNRELQLLEPTLTHRKQTIAPRPNREFSANPCLRNSVLRSVCTIYSALATHHCSAFLTGSDPRTKSSVTDSKQTTATFLTGSRIARLLALSRCCERVDSVSNPHFSAPENLMSHPRPIQIFLRPTI